MILQQQSIQELIKASSPEQKLIWEHLSLLCGEIAAVQRYVYFGNCNAAGELNTNAATSVMFFAYQLEAFTIVSVAGAGTNGVHLVLIGAGQPIIRSEAAFYNTVVPEVQYVGSSKGVENVYFRRVEDDDNNMVIRFIGFKITY